LQVVLITTGTEEFVVERAMVYKYLFTARNMLEGAEVQVYLVYFASSYFPRHLKTNLRGCCLSDIEDSSHVPKLPMTGPILAKILEYFRKRFRIEVIEGKERQDAQEELNAWDLEFLSTVDEPMLFKLLTVRHPFCLWAV
jgi:hypothetical protein